MQNTLNLHRYVFLVVFVVARANAGGLEADISDWARDGVSAEDFPLIEQHNLKDYVQNYLESAAREKGIKAPVVLTSIEPCFFYSEKGSCCSEPDDNVERRKESVSKGIPPIAHKLCLNVQLFRLNASIATMHHELGHAKSAETFPEKRLAMDKEYYYVNKDGPESGRLSQWLQGFQKRKKQLYTYQFQQEQYADAAIPDDKKLLKAERNAFAIHQVGCSLIRNAKTLASKVSPTDSILARIKKLFRGVEFIDFSKPFDESKAQDWDAYMHEEHGDYHPSSYRRAHCFNDRLKVIEAKELTQSIAKGALLDRFSQELTTSDMLS